ncbi:hypothetical protein N7540_001708 [Penicillium herquei]|nr:hypothetical protein N7540_001708 [Penicillium herquei]
MISIDRKSPYITYACASLGATLLHSPRNRVVLPYDGEMDQNVATDYFWSAAKMFTLTLELVNREARKLEIVIASVYRGLLRNEFQHPDTNPEDPLLLLSAILSDTIVFQQVFIQTGKHGHQYLELHANLTPFTPSREFMRIRNDLSTALDNWHDILGTRVPKDMKALYFFCRLVLVCPDVLRLPRIAGYGPYHSGMTGPRDFEILDEALRYSWLILEQVDFKSSTQVDSVWLPVVIFHAALVVGAKLKSVPPEATGEYGTLRSLALFTTELDNMIWPCCESMSAVIEKMMII